MNTNAYYDPDYDYEERPPLPADCERCAQEPDAEDLAFQQQIEEREAFQQEHMMLEDGTLDMTTCFWMNSRKLLSKVLPPTRYLVADMLPQGAAILAAPPKYGKSWLVLDLCLSVAMGEPFLGRKTEQCDTLYLALEDSENRLQKRIYDLLGPDKLPPENFYCGITAGTIGGRLLHQLEVFLHGHPNVGLIVIDTLQKVRDGAKAGSDVYAKDYKDVGVLKTFADEHGICILLVHHLRKAGDSADPFARIAGTTGIQGATDTMFVMTRDERSDDITRLLSNGRDVLAEDFEMRFDKDTFHWKVVENRAARTAEERYRADPLVQTANRLVRENPSGWQGTASELTGWVKDTTGISLTARTLSSQMRHQRDNLLHYDNIIYTPPEHANGNGKRVHTLYKSA